MVKTMGNAEFHALATHSDPILSGETFESKNGFMMQVLPDGRVRALVQLEPPAPTPMSAPTVEAMSSTLPIAPEIQPEMMPISEASISDEFHFEATTTITHTVTGNGPVPASVVEAFRESFSDKQLPALGGTALNSSTRPDTVNTSPAALGNEAARVKPVKKKRQKIYSSIGLKRGEAYKPVILAASALSVVAFTALGIYSLNDAANVGKSCETPFAVATREAHLGDPAQLCESWDLLGDMTNLLNLFTGHR